MASRKAKKEEPENLTPGRIPAAIRGWVLKDYMRIELRRATEDGRSERVSAWDIAEEKNADVLSHRIMTLAREEAEAVGGRVRYTIRVYDGKDPNHRDTRTFVISAENEIGDDDAPLENASPRGVTAQSQRHLENRERTQASLMGDALQAYRDVIGMLRDHSSAQGRELESMRTREAENAELREKLLTEEHYRVIEMNREARKDQFVGKGLELLTKYTPVIIGRLATGGKKGEKLPPFVAEEHVKNLLVSITNNPEKLAAVAAALGPNDMAIVAEIAATFQAAEEKKEQEGTKALPPKANGAAS